MLFLLGEAEHLTSAVSIPTHKGGILEPQTRFLFGKYEDHASLMRILAEKCTHLEIQMRILACRDVSLGSQSFYFESPKKALGRQTVFSRRNKSFPGSRAKFDANAIKDLGRQNVLELTEKKIWDPRS